MHGWDVKAWFGEDGGNWHTQRRQAPIWNSGAVLEQKQLIGVLIQHGVASNSDLMWMHPAYCVEVYRSEWTLLLGLGTEFVLITCWDMQPAWMESGAMISCRKNGMWCPCKAALSFMGRATMVMVNLLECAHTATQRCTTLTTTPGDGCSSLSAVIAGEQMCIKGMSVISVHRRKKITNAIHIPLSDGYPLILSLADECWKCSAYLTLAWWFTFVCLLTFLFLGNDWWLNGEEKDQLFCLRCKMMGPTFYRTKMSARITTDSVHCLNLITYQYFNN